MSKKILVIEDEKGIQEFLRACLEQSGYIVNLASDGVEGMKAFQKELYDLIILDIDMPEMNGIEFMEECRRIKPDVQFVVLSFFENFSYVQSTLRLGGLDYISKTSMELDNGDTILQRIVEKFEQCIGKTVPPGEMEEELVEICKETLEKGRVCQWIFIFLCKFIYRWAILTEESGQILTVI